MMKAITKKDLIKKFQKNPERYWSVSLFNELGFKRKQCKNCGKFFWTLTDEETCSDSTCKPYEFIGNPLTKESMSYLETWNAIKKFFIKHGHTPLKRYPVICRWFPLYFTIAGIVDFYRKKDGELSFEFPANPSILAQPCLRFNDIENTGLNSKSYTSFLMIQQSSLYDGKEGYWKDECIRLDFELLTKVFGIKPEKITFIEDAWLGPEAFGSSLEYYVPGLELGNAVFTEFVGTPANYKEMKQKVIDMGGGLERFAWITQGTPTSYDVTFEPVLRFLRKQTGIKYDVDFFTRFAKLSGSLTLDEVKSMKRAKEDVARKLGVNVKVLEEKIKHLRALYAIADHSLTLAFAIADGGLPSNVAGGYNLRVILRRALSFIDDFGWNIDLTDVCGLHAKHLRPILPELSEHLDKIQEILDIERKKFNETKLRTRRIVETIIQKGEIVDEKKLVDLYDSEGITPELIKKYLPELKIPADFYAKVTEKHMKEKKLAFEKISIDVSNLPPTQLLVYEDQEKLEFQTRVLKMIEDKYVVLDKTYFYPEGGGQKSDVGFIGNFPVMDVQKVGNVILHRVLGKLKEGEMVNCRINKYRREILTKHHTATHIINTSARMILGDHVWQHSAEKTVEKARIDITHYESLSPEVVKRIEEKANEIVRKNLPVKIEMLKRGEAEKKYGFRIYQGGVIPSETLRIVSIGNIDHEACCGLHCKNTGEIEFIKILKTKRIQDGVDRIEFTVGPIALKHLKEKEKLLQETAKLLNVKEEEVPRAVKELFERWKSKKKELRKLRRKKKK